METVDVILPNSKQTIVVIIERKKMKTCRLKIFPSMDVKISIPKATSNEWVINYLKDKSDWIEKKLNGFKATEGYASTTEIKNGMSIKMLGQEVIFSVKKCENEYIQKENKILHIGVSDISDQEHILKVFDKWWRKEALNEYNKYLDKLYPIVGKYDIPKPQIRIKKMKTLWGSCSVNSGVITLNQYLFKARPACIEYVILHELIHLIYPNHSKNFYDFLSNYMPDWKDRKRYLDYDVVHGL